MLVIDTSFPAKGFNERNGEPVRQVILPAALPCQAATSARPLRNSAIARPKPRARRSPAGVSITERPRRSTSRCPSATERSATARCSEADDSPVASAATA